MPFKFTSKMYYLPLTAFFADVLCRIFCSPPLFTHGKFLVGRVGQMLGVYPTMTPQKPRIPRGCLECRRALKGTLNEDLRKQAVRKKVRAGHRKAPVSVHLRIFP